MISHSLMLDQILHRDIISLIAKHLGQMDMMALCVAHAPLQSILRSQIGDMAIMAQPLCLIEYDIDQCTRLADLLEISSREDLTSFHRMPKTLRIRESQLNISYSRYYADGFYNAVAFTPDSINYEARQQSDTIWNKLFSKVVKACPNITEFVFEADNSSITCHMSQVNLSHVKCYMDQCSLCRMVELLEAIPPMTCLKKLLLSTDTSFAIQRSIARIIQPSQLDEFEYIANDSPSIDPELVASIKNQGCLKSLTVLGGKTSPLLSRLIVYLSSNFSTINSLHIDDRSWESFDRAHVLELLATLEFPALTSFRYDATLYQSLRENPFGGGVRPHMIRLMSRPLSNSEIAYLETNKGPMLTKFLVAYPSLTHVALNRCSFLNDTFFLSAWEYLPNLISMSIRDCSDIHGKYISRSSGAGWPKLAKLDLSTCKNISFRCIMAIAATTLAEDVQLTFHSDISNQSQHLQLDMQALGYEMLQTPQPSSIVFKRFAGQIHDVSVGIPFGLGYGISPSLN